MNLHELSKVMKNVHLLMWLRLYVIYSTFLGSSSIDFNIDSDSLSESIKIRFFFVSCCIYHRYLVYKSRVIRSVCLLRCKQSVNSTVILNRFKHYWNYDFYIPSYIFSYKKITFIHFSFYFTLSGLRNQCVALLPSWKGGVRS